MGTPQRLSVAFGTHLAKIDRQTTLTWHEYVALLVADPPVSDDKASRGWSLPGRFAGNWRDADSLIERTALTLDFDVIARADVPRIEKALAGYEHVLYTTASHTAEKPRLRAVIPLDRPMAPDEFSAVSRRVAADIGIELVSRESHVPTQMMFLPVRKPGGVWRVKKHAAPRLAADKVLARYQDWTNREEWPRRKEHDSTRRAELVASPLDKPGLVGDFCRLYRVTEAIHAFGLPYRHEAGNRWTYTRGSRPEGAVVYDDDTKLHSHHDSDPAHGQHNAFDLVRLHKYHNLDLNAPVGDPTMLPSYKAMEALYRDDAMLVTRRLEAVQGDLPALPPWTPEEDLKGQQVRLANPAAVEMDKRAAANALRAEAGQVIGAKRLDWVLDNPTVTEWLLPRMLERRVIAVMAGPRGSYKSFLALDWAMQVAVKGTPVYVVSAEGGDFDRRAAAWLSVYGAGVDPRSIPLYVVERRLDLNCTEGINAIINDCKTLSVVPELFVLDTFSKLSGGLDENDNTEVKQFIGRLDNGLRRQQPKGATVLIVAHTGHSDKGRPRGASAFGADTDAEYIVAREGANSDLIKVTRERFKSSPELPPLRLRPEIVPLQGRVDLEGERVTSVVLRPEAVADAGAPRKGEYPQPRGKMQLLAWNACKDVLREGPVDAETLVNRVVAALIAPGAGERDTRRQTARRVLEALIVSGVLYMPEPNMVGLNRVVNAEEELL